MPSYAFPLFDLLRGEGRFGILDIPSRLPVPFCLVSQGLPSFAPQITRVTVSVTRLQVFAFVVPI